MAARQRGACGPYALYLCILTRHSFRACRGVSVGIIRFLHLIRLLLLRRLLMHVRCRCNQPLLLSVEV